jgi:hypothetical protein
MGEGRQDLWLRSPLSTAAGKFVVPVIDRPAVLVKTTSGEGSSAVEANNTWVFPVQVGEKLLTGLAVELVTFEGFVAAVAGRHNSLLAY